MILKHLRTLLQRCKSLENVKQIHAQSVTIGVHNNQPLASKLLNTYTKLGRPLEAHKVFDQIPNPDIVSWTCLISLYLHTERLGKAFSIFSRLIYTGLKPDTYSVVGALSACGRSKDMANGKIVHAMILRFELGTDPIVGNALIDMYCRNGKIQGANLVFADMETKDVASWTSLLNGFVICNDLESARGVFDRMPLKNLISWTAMITGYVRSKTPIQAMELFRQMRVECEDPPTAITIVAVLSGCADIGALDFGRSIHGSISKGSLNLDVSVNNALMDMYAKSGYLDSTTRIFRDMLKKDAFSWTTMISGFALHGKGHRALEVFYDMMRSKADPNDVTFVSVLSACSHAGLVSEGQSLFNQMIICYGLEPKIEHYGCMVDLLGRAGLLEAAKDIIEQMRISPDAVIWRSLLSSCLAHGNLELAEFAGKKVIGLEPDDDGVYILLWNIYCSENKWEEALKTRKMMRDRRVKKRPGCSWVEVNGVVQEFLAKDTTHCDRLEVYLVLEGIAEQSKFDNSYSGLELDNLISSGEGLLNSS